MSLSKTTERLLTVLFGEKTTSPPHGESKRLVHKSRYIALMSQKVAFSLNSLLLVVLTALCIVACIGFLIGSVLSLADARLAIAYFILCILCCQIAWLAKRAAEGSMKKASQEINVLPLTKANMSHLLSQDSLVRATNESAQEQQSVLLRAATGHVIEESVDQHATPTDERK